MSEPVQLKDGRWRLQQPDAKASPVWMRRLDDGRWQWWFYWTYGPVGWVARTGEDKERIHDWKGNPDLWEFGIEGSYGSARDAAFEQMRHEPTFRRNRWFCQ